MNTTLIDRFPEKDWKRNEPLTPHTYMKVGGNADLLLVVTSKDELFEICSYCFQEKIPFIVLGGASNVIVPDEGLQKVVFINKSSSIVFSGNQKDIVTADSGVITAVLANKTMEQGLSGLEYFIGVPGTIGGAIVNNSHFTAKDLVGNLVREVDVCTIEGKRETWKADALKFDYDFSVFHERGDVVLSATFQLMHADPASIQEKVKAAALKRVSTQPIGVPSSGCMYRNPQISPEQFITLTNTVDVPQGAYHLREDGKYHVAAGFLIESLGLKGAQVGDAQVSEKHATYMINTGHATKADIESLCQKIEDLMKSSYGISLEREVFFL